MVIWCLVGYSWITAAIGFGITCVIATSVYRIISTHQYKQDENGGIQPDISTAEYVCGSHREMFVTVICFALIMLFDLLAGQKITAFFESLSTDAVAYLKAGLLLIPLVILGLRLVGTMTPQAIGSLYKAAFDPKL